MLRHHSLHHLYRALEVKAFARTNVEFQRDGIQLFLTMHREIGPLPGRVKTENGLAGLSENGPASFGWVSLKYCGDQSTADRPPSPQAGSALNRAFSASVPMWFINRFRL